MSGVCVCVRECVCVCVSAGEDEAGVCAFVCTCLFMAITQGGVNTSWGLRPLRRRSFPLEPDELLTKTMRWATRFRLLPMR